MSERRGPDEGEREMRWQRAALWWPAACGPATLGVLQLCPKGRRTVFWLAGAALAALGSAALAYVSVRGRDRLPAVGYAVWACLAYAATYGFVASLAAVARAL